MKHTVTGAAAIAALLLTAASPALAAPTSRSYEATLTGTQESSWTFEESGTCTGDDFATYTFSGTGSGSARMSFRTPRASTVVAFQDVRSKRWGFNYQVSPLVASQRDESPLVKGAVIGTHSQVCPNNETATKTFPTTGCGERSYRLQVKASLNLPSSGRPGELVLTGVPGGPASGAKWGDDCPYFPGLDALKAHGNDDQPFHIPAGGLLTVRKTVGSGALRRGKRLTITGKRTMPYDQEISDGETTRKIKGSTVIRWQLALRPKR